MNDITVFAQEQDNIFKDITSFDFGSLNSQDAAFIAKNHQEIISVCEQGTLMIGERLAKIKETLKHQQNGQGWIEYLKYTPWNAVQADRFIAEYENPEKFFLYKKNFGEAGARRLLRAPESVQDEIMKRVDEGETVNNQKINDAIRRRCFQK